MGRGLLCLWGTYRFLCVATDLRGASSVSADRLAVYPYLAQRSLN